MAVTSTSDETNEVEGHLGLKSRTLRPRSSKTPREPLTNANAKLSAVSSADPSMVADLESAEDEFALAAATVEAIVGRSLAKRDCREDPFLGGFGTGGNAHSITVKGSASDLSI
eukprot:Gb_06601 [translate_table: standard]